MPKKKDPSSKKLPKGEIKLYKDVEVWVAFASKKSKYGNRRSYVYGLSFHSFHEACRYIELVEKLEQGLIRGLKTQPTFKLTAHGEEICRYKADFQYEQEVNGEWVTVVEDVKGSLTDVYKIKQKWFLAQYKEYLFRETRKLYGKEMFDIRDY